MSTRFLVFFVMCLIAPASIRGQESPTEREAARDKATLTAKVADWVTRLIASVPEPTEDGQVPLHFLIRAGGATKLLQAAGGPDWHQTGWERGAATRTCREGKASRCVRSSSVVF